MKWLKRIASVLLVVYVIAMASLYFLQDDILFLPDKLPAHYEFRMGEEVFLPVADGVDLHCLHLRSPSPRGVILYLHGNRGSNRRCLRQAENLLQEGYDLFMPDYRGYGKSDGVMENQRQAFQDVQIVYEHLKNHYQESEITIVGYSLGSAMASHLAASNKPANLVLVAPFFSIVDMKNKRLPIVPSFLLKYPFCTNKAVEESSCPIHIFHGTGDELIPFDSAERLARIAPHRTTLIALEGEGHRGSIFSRTIRRGLTKVLRK